MQDEAPDWAHSRRALTCVSAEVTAEHAISILKHDGVVVIENLLPPPALESFRRDLDPWFVAACHGAGPFFGRRTRRFNGLLTKVPSTGQLAAHELVLAIVETVLRGDPEKPVCSSVELNLTQAVGIEPGEPAQFLHRDEGMWPFAHDFEVMANAMWTLDDFTLENGATRLIPGSHKWTRDRKPKVGEARPAVAPAGSVIIWLGGVLHGGGANCARTMRRGIVFSYRLGWLAPSEKLLLTTPFDLARSFPERLQRLIGYQMHRPNLGAVEGQDPLRWLNGEVGDLVAIEDNLSEVGAKMIGEACDEPERFPEYFT